MVDDYKNEFLPQLEQSKIYTRLKRNCVKNDTEVIALVNLAVAYAYQRTKTIIKHMGEFTLHDSDHLFRVLHLMERLIPEQTIKNLSTPELMLLIISAFFHDIGMAPDEKEVLTWKMVWDLEPTIEPENKGTFQQFQRFYATKPEQKEIIERLLKQGKNTNADTAKAYLITEFIRQTHAEKAKEVIAKDWKGKIVYRDTDLTVALAQICYSHNEDALSLLDLEKDYLCSPNIYACLPLVGVILRLADILDFDAKRTPEILFSHLYVRDPISLSEWNKHRAVAAWEINSEIIQFSARCKHPAIEASIHKFCDFIDHELGVCNNVISKLNEFNKKKKRKIEIKFPLKVSREKIKTKQDIDGRPIYQYRNTQFTLSKHQVIDLLMGTKLYANPELALRELLQNSIDACLLRQAQEKKWGNLYKPEISVRYYRDERDTILEVEDNGTGMDQDIIDNYYSKIGTSFYKSTDFYSLKAETEAEFTPTSRFGIGILSCFMVSDTLVVDTKRVYREHQSSDALNITVEGQDSIFWIQKGERKSPGTTTKLILRKEQNPWLKMKDEEFIQSLKKVIPNPPIKVNIRSNEQLEVIDERSFENATLIDFTKGHYWDNDDNVKVFDIKLDRKDVGIVGFASVAILEEDGYPVNSKNMNEVNVEIQGTNYILSRRLSFSINCFNEFSDSITVDSDGDICNEHGMTDLFKSGSRLSLHGIEVPTSLFSDQWNTKKNQPELSFPFPIYLVIDICGKRDLDLNSARTEIILSEKWYDLEEQLTFIICTEISKQVTEKYWGILKEIFHKSSNENFLKGLRRVVK